MTTCSGFTVMFFFANLRFGFSFVVSGSVTAATTTERRALTALPGLAPKRACAVVAMGTVSDQTGWRVESRRFRGAAFPAPTVGGDESERAYPLTMRINVAATRRSRAGSRVRTWTAGATAAMADMADMFTKTKDGADGARARRVMPAARRTPKSAFRRGRRRRESYRQPPAGKRGSGARGADLARFRDAGFGNEYVVVKKRKMRTFSSARLFSPDIRARWTTWPNPRLFWSFGLDARAFSASRRRLR